MSKRKLEDESTSSSSSDGGGKRLKKTGINYFPPPSIDLSAFRQKPRWRNLL